MSRLPAPSSADPSGEERGPGDESSGPDGSTQDGWGRGMRTVAPADPPRASPIPSRPGAAWLADISDWNDDLVDPLAAYFEIEHRARRSGRRRA